MLQWVLREPLQLGWSACAPLQNLSRAPEIHEACHWHRALESGEGVRRMSCRSAIADRLWRLACRSGSVKYELLRRPQKGLAAFLALQWVGYSTKVVEGGCGCTRLQLADVPRGQAQGLTDRTLGEHIHVIK